MRVLYFVLFFLTLFFDTQVVSQEALSTDISEIMVSPQSQNAVFAISVRDEQGAEVYNHQGRSRLIPASTYKLVTTLSALDILGRDFIFETKVSYRGQITDGELIGDIIFSGSGDPSLGATRYSGDDSYEQVLRDVSSYIKTAGIKKIKERVMVDQSHFDRIWVHPSWAWDDLTNYFAGGAAAFNIHENLFFLDFNRSPTSDQPTTISRVSPDMPDLDWTNRVKTGPPGSGDNAYIYGDPYDTKRWIEGTIPPAQVCLR